MGVVKTASESVLEDNVVPSEEANYSVQGYAGKFFYVSFLLFSSSSLFFLFFSNFRSFFPAVLGARILHRVFTVVSSCARVRYHEATRAI